MKTSIGIIGLGYVGLPLAIEFGKFFDVIGYDINKKRSNELNNKIDKNKDILRKDFIESSKSIFTSTINDLKLCNIYIITVPTPIKNKNIPDLKYIKQACNDISQFVKKNDVIILESTVYPGTTEEICAPLIEKKSKLKFNKDFFMGYSPERINPNDKINNIRNIIKVTSGSNNKTALLIDNLYKKIIKAGTYKANNIKVAEAAKVIENSQRDINIAFMNELCLIFDKLNIDTHDVLKAASTKWNFINFKPGIVGGHCIGVDPYYLTYKSKERGYTPKIITSGRKINDNFVYYIIQKSISETKKVFKINKLKFLVLGLTFKENCLDYRNSQSLRLIKLLKNKKFTVDCFDPLIDANKFNKNNIIKLSNNIKNNWYHCIIITVAHNYFKNLGENKIRKFLVKDGIIFDVKNIFPKKKGNIYL